MCVACTGEPDDTLRDLENEVSGAAEIFADAFFVNKYGARDTYDAAVALRDAATAYVGYLERMHGFPDPS